MERIERESLVVILERRSRVVVFIEALIAHFDVFESQLLQLRLILFRLLRFLFLLFDYTLYLIKFVE